MSPLAHGIDPRLVDYLQVGGGYGDADGGLTLSSDGNLQMDGTLTVDGNVTVGGNVSIVGDISLDDITADTIAVGGGYGDADGGLSIDALGVLQTDGGISSDATITANLFSGPLTGDVTGDVTGNLVEATSTAKNLNPETDTTYGLGTTLIRWANLYADNVDTSTLTVGSTSIFTGLITANGGVNAGTGLIETDGNLNVAGTGTFGGNITQTHAGDSQFLVESTDDNAIVKLKGPSGFASRLIWNEANVDAFQIYWNGTDHLNFYADNTLNAITAQVQESTGDWTFKYNVNVDGTSTFTGLIDANGGVSGDLTGDVTGDVTGDLTGNLLKATSTAKNLNPETDSTYDLGTTLIRWANMYADNVNTATLTATGNAEFNSALVKDIASGTDNEMLFQTDGTTRWGIKVSDTLGVFSIDRYVGGVYNSSPFSFNATAGITFSDDVTMSQDLNTTGDILVKGGYPAGTTIGSFLHTGGTLVVGGTSVINGVAEFNDLAKFNSAVQVENAYAAHLDADRLVIAETGLGVATGMTLGSHSDGVGNIFFGDDLDTKAGNYSFNHTSNQHQWGIANTDYMTLTSAIFNLTSATVAMSGAVAMTGSLDLTSGATLDVNGAVDFDSTLDVGGDTLLSGAVTIGDLTGMAAAQAWADDIHIGRGGSAAGLTISATSTCNIHLGDAASPERGRIQYDNNGSTNDLTSDTLYAYTGATRFLSSTSTATKFSLDVDMLQDLDVTGTIAAGGHITCNDASGTSLIQSTANHVQFKTTGASKYCLLAAGTGGNMFIDCGATFTWRDVDASNATRMTLNSATGDLDITGDLQVDQNVTIDGSLTVSGGNGSAILSNGGNQLYFTRDGGAFIDAQGTGGKIYFRTNGINNALLLDEAQAAIFYGAVTMQDDLDVTGALDVTGDLTAANFAPPAYGCMHRHVTSPDTVGTAAGGWVKYAHFDTEVEEGTLVTTDIVTNDRITIGTGGAGVYEVTWDVSFTCSSTTAEIETTVFVNGTAGTQLTGATLQREIKTSGNYAATSAGTLVSLSDADYLEVFMRDNQTTEVDTSVKHMNFRVIRKG